jgi:hypothetical protein
VYLAARELEELEELAKQGTQIEARAVPAEPPVALPALRERFLRGFP